MNDVERPARGWTARVVEIFITSKLSVLFLIASLAAGAVALLATPREEEPQIVVPFADVLVEMPGASAEEVENLVATPLEAKLWEIDGVEYVYSMSRPGMAVVTVGTVRNHVEAVNPRIKSLNYLNNILAKIEAINAGVMECIMLNPQGNVAEASGDNIFAIHGNTLITPPSWCGALEGITRGAVMELAAGQGLVVREQVTSRYDLYTADEVFLTGTAAEIISVTNIDRRPVGDGKPGPVTARLARAFHELTQHDGTPIR